MSPRVLQREDTITVDTVLANDLTCHGDGLTIGVDNVRLDLGGHTLTGPGRGPWVWPNRALSSVGIRAEGREGVWIGNGLVATFATGVLVDNTTQSEVYSVVSRENFYGIYLLESTGNWLTANVVDFNTYGIHLQMSNGNAVIRNDSVTNLYQSPGWYGINLIESDDNEIRENLVSANEEQGIWPIDSRGNTIYHNNLIGNNPNGVDNLADNR